MPTRTAAPRALIVAVALAGAVGLAGCTAPPVAPDPRTATASAPATADTVEEPAAALGCDELVAPEALAAALTGADGLAPSIARAADAATDPFAAVLLPAAGGLACSWRTGEPHDPEAPDGDGDWAYLTVEVLPGPSEDVQPWAYADVPETFAREIGGSPALAACGDPGCRIGVAAPDAWIQVELRADGWNVDASRFAGIDTATLLDRLASVAADGVAAVARGGRPAVATPTAAATPDCSGVGETVAAAVAPMPLDALVRVRAAAVDCDTAANGRVTIVPGAADAIAELGGSADYGLAMHRIGLGDGAISSCRPGAGRCRVLLALHGDAYLVDAPDAEALAGRVADARR